MNYLAGVSGNSLHYVVYGEASELDGMSGSVRVLNMPVSEMSLFSGSDYSLLSGSKMFHKGIRNSVPVISNTVKDGYCEIVYLYSESMCDDVFDYDDEIGKFKANIEFIAKNSIHLIFNIVDGEKYE